MKLANQVQALEQLGRSLQMFTDKAELTLDDATVARLQEARKRLAGGK